MNEKKICFIMCVTNSKYQNASVEFISNIEIPKGYEIDLLTVEDALSMTSGYNEAMAVSDAKYKVYLHQDVMIINKHFIREILRIFENAEIGMIGMVGAPLLPENGIMWFGDRIGKIYNCNTYETSLLEFNDATRPYEEVQAIDGLLMATQYDISWREDIFNKWDFYDVSQSFEYRKAGYKIVVPYMESPWVIHDDGFMKLKDYYGERKIFIDEYLR